jgi:hypothetical protein
MLRFLHEEISKPVSKTELVIKREVDIIEEDSEREEKEFSVEGQFITSQKV